MAGETTESENYGYIPIALIVLGITTAIGLVPYIGGFVALIAGIIGVVLILSDSGRMSPAQRRPVYYSIVFYIVGIGVAVIGIFAVVLQILASHPISQGITQTDIQNFLNAYIPYIIVTAILSYLAYMMLPFGLSNSREKYMLYVAFVVSLASSFLSSYLTIAGYFHFTSIPSTTVAFTGLAPVSNLLLSKAIGVPGALLWAFAYISIGWRMRKNQLSGSKE